MEEIVHNIIETTLSSFDFAYCLMVNVATYLATTILCEWKPLGTWAKRLVLLIIILVTGIAYYLFGEEPKLLLNSAILAPFTWDWVFKPLLKLIEKKLKSIK
jgi:hypothetical protein